jgi:hypothetical protein
MSTVTDNATPLGNAARSKRDWRLVMIGYGVLVALFGVWHLDRTVANNAPVMPTRSDGVTQSLEVLAQGGPPLLRALPRWAGSHPPAGTGYADIGSDDDPGLYFYLPVFGNALGVQDTALLVKWTFVVLMAVVLAVYPLVFYELLGSAAAAAVAPLLVLWRFSQLGNYQFYWIGAWVTLLALPILMLLIARRWRRASTVLIGLVALAAGLASSFRGLAGVGVLLACLLAAAYVVRPWRRLLGVVLVVIGCYWATGYGVIEGARAYRNHVVGYSLPLSHTTPLHNFYIGLGYLDNPYGIYYSDSVALEAALQVDPNAQFESPRYPGAMRRVVENLWHKNPWFIAANLWDKSIAITRDALHRFELIIVLVPLALITAGRRIPIGRWLTLALPTFLVLALPPLLVLPLYQYELGWFGAWGFVWLFCIAFLLARCEDVLRNAPLRARIRALGWTRDPRRSIGAVLSRRSVVVSVLLIGLTLALAEAPIARTRGANYGQSPQFRLVSPASKGTVLHRWRLWTGLPSGWTNKGARLKPNGQRLDLSTTESTLDHQLEGPAEQLASGHYEVLVDGAVKTGSIDVGVLNVTTGVWVTEAIYFAGLPFQGHLMAAQFMLPASTKVRVVLANWMSVPGISIWSIGSISIRRESASDN